MPLQAVIPGTLPVGWLGADPRGWRAASLPGGGRGFAYWPSEPLLGHQMQRCLLWEVKCLFPIFLFPSFFFFFLTPQGLSRWERDTMTSSFQASGVSSVGFFPLAVKPFPKWFSPPRCGGDAVLHVFDNPGLQFSLSRSSFSLIFRFWV